MLKGLFEQVANVRYNTITSALTALLFVLLPRYDWADMSSRSSRRICQLRAELAQAPAWPGCGLGERGCADSASVAAGRGGVADARAGSGGGGAAAARGRYMPRVTGWPHA